MAFIFRFRNKMRASTARVYECEQTDGAVEFTGRAHARFVVAFEGFHAPPNPVFVASAGGKFGSLSAPQVVGSGLRFCGPPPAPAAAAAAAAAGSKGLTSSAALCSARLPSPRRPDTARGLAHGSPVEQRPQAPAGRCGPALCRPPSEAPEPRPVPLRPRGGPGAAPPRARGPQSPAQSAPLPPHGRQPPRPPRPARRLEHRCAAPRPAHGPAPTGPAGGASRTASRRGHQVPPSRPPHGRVRSGRPPLPPAPPPPSTLDSVNRNPPGPCGAYPTSVGVLSTLQTPRAWGRLCAEQCRRRRGRDAKGQKQRL